jgi:hypothetical protein
MGSPAWINKSLPKYSATCVTGLLELYVEWKNNKSPGSAFANDTGTLMLKSPCAVVLPTLAAPLWFKIQQT